MIQARYPTPSPASLGDRDPAGARPPAPAGNPVRYVLDPGDERPRPVRLAPETVAALAARHRRTALRETFLILGTLAAIAGLLLLLHSPLIPVAQALLASFLPAAP